jgi:hypothetical protein
VKGPDDRYTIGNILGAIGATLVSAGLACYALFGEPTGRIGRNWQFVALTGVVGALACGWAVIKGVRSRRR